MRRVFAIILLVLLIFLFYQPLQKENLRLVVYISVDQLRYDYLERFNNLFSDSGYNLLRSSGASFTNCNYEHYCTYTGPGHATLGTGCYGGKSGITGNDLYDFENNKDIYCAEDKNYRSAEPGDSSRAGNISPKNLIISTLGDELKTNNPESKVFAVSFKDRAAVLMAGKNADAAYWMNYNNGHFITSTFYQQKLPEWAIDFNNTGKVDSYFDRNWEKYLPEDAYSICSIDNYPYEMNPRKMGRTFPHPVNAGLEKPGYNYYKNLRNTPFGDELTLEFAKKFVENENLGKDDHTDLLCISFSVTDYIGHEWGPDSYEMLDHQVRLDRMLQEFFMYLDKKIDLDNILIVLTADHGSAAIPELDKERGKDAGKINYKTVEKIAERSIRNTFGNPPEGMNWTTLIDGANVYINSNLYKLKKADRQKVRAILADSLKSIEGIQRIVTRDEINSAINDPILDSVRKGFNPDRSAEVILIQKPYWSFLLDNDAATHGSPHKYDTHVPMMFLGSNIKAGVYDQPVGPTDAVVTIAAILGFKMQGERDGKNLTSVITK